MKLRFTASSISSIAISRTMTFLRLRNIPTTLIANSNAPKIRKWASVGVALMTDSVLFFRRHGNQPYTVGALDPNLL